MQCGGFLWLHSSFPERCPGRSVLSSFKKKASASAADVGCRSVATQSSTDGTLCGDMCSHQGDMVSLYRMCWYSGDMRRHWHPVASNDKRWRSGDMCWAPPPPPKQWQALYSRARGLTHRHGHARFNFLQLPRAPAALRSIAAARRANPRPTPPNPGGGVGSQLVAVVWNCSVWCAGRECKPPAVGLPHAQWALRTCTPAPVL